MKKIRNIFLLALCIVCHVFIVTYPKTTTAKTTTSTKKLTLYVGDEKQLNVWKNKVTWSVSDKDCVSVSKTGKIQALKKGKATITAVHGNKKKKFKITVKNLYLNVDFNNVAKITVRHGTYGFLTQVNYDDFINIEKLFEDNVFYRYIPLTKAKAGSTRYSIELYDSNDQIIWSFSIGYRDGEYIIDYYEEGLYYKGLSYQGKIYKPQKTLDLSFFDSLFEDHSLFI